MMRPLTAAALALAALVPCLLAADAAGAADVRVFVVRDEGRRFSIEPVTIPEGRTEVFTCGDGGAFVDVVFPPSPGTSASLAQAQPARRIAVTHSGGTPRVTVHVGDRTHDMTALEDPGSADRRVSVVAGDGRRQAFLIRGFSTVSEDTTGPVLDLFAGRIPLQPGDAVVCTETSRRWKGPAPIGSAALEFDRYRFGRVAMPSAGTRDAVVDLAAGQTVVARALVPAGVALAPGHVTRHVAGRSESAERQMGGATGDVGGVLGQAVLPELKLGDLVFRDAEVTVLDTLPHLAGREVAAIIGLDLLSRAPNVTLEYPRGQERAGRLRLAETSGPRAPGALESPFSIAGSHLVVGAGVGGTRTFLMLDSSAPATLLDRPCAEAAGLEVTSAARELHGLGGQGQEVAATTIPVLSVAGRRFDSVAADVAPLPVFATLHAHGQSMGLLGNDVLSRLGSVEIDFARGVIRVPGER